jgi:hypothetical protein
VKALGLLTILLAHNLPICTFEVALNPWLTKRSGPELSLYEVCADYGGIPIAAWHRMINRLNA